MAIYLLLTRAALLLYVICSFLQAMDANKCNWDKLFELYPFFEAYKNYLQIDVTAANAADLMNWKGWVESRLRQLTLKVISISLTAYMSYFICTYTDLLLVPDTWVILTTRLRGILLTCFSAIHTQGTSQTNQDHFIVVTLWVSNGNKEWLPMRGSSLILG